MDDQSEELEGEEKEKGKDVKENGKEEEKGKEEFMSWKELSRASF